MSIYSTSCSFLNERFFGFTVEKFVSFTSDGFPLGDKFDMIQPVPSFLNRSIRPHFSGERKTYIISSWFADNLRKPTVAEIFILIGQFVLL